MKPPTLACPPAVTQRHTIPPWASAARQSKCTDLKQVRGKPGSAHPASQTTRSPGPSTWPLITPGVGQMRGAQAMGAGATPCVQDPQQRATEATAGARLRSELVQGKPAHHRKMSPKESTSKHQPAGGSGEGTRAAATHAGRHPEKTAIKHHHGREGVRDQGSQLWPW